MSKEIGECGSCFLFLNSGPFLRRRRAGRETGPTISAGELARDNVASHTESVKSYHLGRLVSRVVNHDEKSRRLFDAFYNALKVTINYRGAHTVERVPRNRASTYIRVCVCICVCMHACVDTCVGFT